MKPALQVVPSIVAEPTREYILKVLQFPKRKIRAGCRQSKPRHSSAAITWLYRQFVEGHLPRYPSSEHFITGTLPFLLTAMSPEAAMIMAAVFGRRHSSLWHGDMSGHMAACRKQVDLLLPAIHDELPYEIHQRLQPLQVRCRKPALTALVICSSLANPQGGFFLDCRSLQRRLLLSNPMAALRILRRLQSSGIIAKTTRGNLPWTADGKREANAYVFLKSVTQ